MKFLGMQIMIEGLALGAFGVMRKATQEPLLRELLRYVITDEARHVHYGVTALGQYYATLTARELREREDWAYEIALLMRNRFRPMSSTRNFTRMPCRKKSGTSWCSNQGTCGSFAQTCFDG